MSASLNSFYAKKKGEIMEYKIVQIGVEYEYSEFLCSYLAKNDSSFSFSLSIRRQLKGLNNVLFRLHTSRKINSIIKLPFKGVWAKKAIGKNSVFLDSDYLCFIYQGGIQYFDIGVFAYIRKRFKNSILIYQYNDLVSLNEKLYPGFLELCKKTFDFILTFNPIDAEEYKLILCPPFVPDFGVEIFEKKDYKSDVFFVGKDKGRLDTLIRLFDDFSKNGLICDFYICGVDKKKQIYPDRIHYNKFLSYKEVVSKTAMSKCVLNVLQNNSNGITLRDLESINMGKILITNNYYIKSTSLYDPKRVLFLDKPIPFEYIKSYKNSKWNIKQPLSGYDYLLWIKGLIGNGQNEK